MALLVPLQVSLHVRWHFVTRRWQSDVLALAGDTRSRRGVGTASEDATPFGEEALVSWGKRECFHFVGGEPTEFDAFWADFERCGFGSDEHPTDIEVFMLGFVLAGWDGVNVEIEGAWRGDD